MCATTPCPSFDNLSQLRPKLSSIVDNYLDIQQDILETSSIGGSSDTSPSPRSSRTVTHSRLETGPPAAAGLSMP